MKHVILWLTLALSAPIQAAEVVEYALAVKNLVSLNDEARDSGLRPRMSNPEAAKALSIAGDSQRFLFSGPVSPNELAIFCQVSTALVQLYRSDVYKPTSAAETQISKELQKVKDALLSVEGCEAGCVMLDRP